VRVDEIGEFALIAQIEALLADEAPGSASLRLGIGDDAAIYQPAPRHSLVITTDALVEGIHFRLDIMDWADVGYRALAANLSDLASMGARAGAAVVTLGLRPGLLVEDVLAFYHGLAGLAARYNCSIAGGDIVASPAAVTVSITAFGECRHERDGTPRCLRRDTARAGDLIAVTGRLGASAAGLSLLLAGRTDAADALIRAYRRPEPRLREGSLLLEAGVRTGMDLSDGLAGDLPKICARSRVSAFIDGRALPAPAIVKERFPDTWLDLALRGGEDFELLVTFPPALLGQITTALAAADLPPLTVIGHVEPPGDSPLWFCGDDGQRRPLSPGAYDHFGHQPPDRGATI
jgi:thiamine-monophosphate kinase